MAGDDTVRLEDRMGIIAAVNAEWRAVLETVCSESGVPQASCEWDKGIEHAIQLAIQDARIDQDEATRRQLQGAPNE